MRTAHAITRRADRDGVSSAVVERDYVLAHIVAQLHLVALEKNKVPPTGVEPAHMASEANALSTELRGHTRNIRL